MPTARPKAETLSEAPNEGTETADVTASALLTVEQQAEERALEKACKIEQERAFQHRQNTSVEREEGVLRENSTPGMVPVVGSAGIKHWREKPYKGPRRSDKKSPWASARMIDKPNDKSKEKTKLLPKYETNAMIEVTDLQPLAPGQQAEGNRIRWKADMVRKREALRQSLSNLIKEEEGVLSQTSTPETVLGVGSVGIKHSGGNPNQGPNRSEWKSPWGPAWMIGESKPKDKPKDKTKNEGITLSKAPNDVPDIYLPYTDLAPAPLTPEQQAEQKRILYEARIRKRDTDCISASEGRLRMETINTLDSQKADLEMRITNLENTVLELQGQREAALVDSQKYWKRYQEIEKFVLPLRDSLRHKFRCSVDENGHQPLHWTLSFCAQEFEALENERIEREAISQTRLAEKDAYCQQQMSNKDREYQQQLRAQEEEHQRETQYFRSEVANAIDHCEKTKCDMESQQNQAVATMADKYEIDMKTISNRHDTEVRTLRDEITQMENALLTMDRFQPLPGTLLIKRFTDLKRVVENVSRGLPQVEGDVMSRAFEETAFVKASEFVEIAPRKHWRYLLEGTFWNIIMCGFFATPFSVFGIYGLDFLDFWHDLFEERKLIPCLSFP